MTLSPQAQTLVDQLVQVMGLQALRPISLDIDMDDAGIVQRIEPRLRFRPKVVDKAKA